jgi:hypothetical protein
MATMVRVCVFALVFQRRPLILLYYIHSFLFLLYFSIYLLVEYQTHPSMKWHPAMYEQSVVEELRKSQFHSFVERVKTTDCQAELRRLLASGPPIYISDKHAMPVPDGDTHIVKLWYASASDDSSQEMNATLDGAVEGEERQKLWDELKEFIIEEGKEPGDEDDKTEEQQES